MYYYVLYIISTYFTFFVIYIIMNLYFGPAALHYIINNILSYLWYNQTFKIGGNSFSSKMTLTGEYNLLATL